MVSFFGDYDTSETVCIPFNTFSSDDPSASVTITNLVAGDVEIHKDGGTTQRSSDAGVTVTIDFDSVTGNHMLVIDLSDNTDAGFYSAGSRYQVRVEGTTVDGATVNAWIGAFSIGCTLRPSTDGRTIAVDANGRVDVSLIEGGDATDALSAATPTVTLADDAITSAKFDESTAFPLTSADTGSTAVARTGADSDTLETLSDQLDAVPDSAAINAACDTALTDYDAVVPGDLPANFADLAITATTGRVDVASIEGSDATDQIRDAVVDDSTRIDASALNTLSSHDPGEAIMGATDLATEMARIDADVSSRAVAGDAMTLQDDAITAAKYDEATAFPLGSADTGATAVARTGADSDTLETLSDEIAGVSGLDAAGVRAALGMASADLDDQLDALPTAAEAADAVWDETIADHAGVGSTGAALAAAGGSGDPWSTAVPGAYGAGTAGYILGTNVDATVSSRGTADPGDEMALEDGAITAAKIATDALTAAKLAADAVAEIQSGLATSAALATVDGNVDTLIARLTAARAGYLDNLSGGAVALASALSAVDTVVDAIQAVTDNLPDSGALTTIATDAARLTAARAQAITDLIDGGRLDLLIDAIKERTDNLPDDPADDSDIDGQLSTITTAIGNLNDVSLAQITTEIFDALATDTYAEIGQESPGATVALAYMLRFLYKKARNKEETDYSTGEHKLYNNDGTTVGQKATVSDDGTIFTKGEVGSGA